MKIFFSLIIILFVVASVFGQNRLSRDSADFYLHKIDNHSVSISYNYVNTINVNTDAQILISNGDRYIIDRLIDCLEDRNKMLICHVLLTKLLVIEDKSFRYSSEKSADSVIYSFTYNRLSWKELIIVKPVPKSEIILDFSQLKDLKHYWVSQKNNYLYRLRTIN